MFQRQSFSLSAVGVFLSLSALAQAPAGAPAGATGLCRDGTYSNATSKRGACSGHQGVQSWFANSSAAQTWASAQAAPAQAAAPATAAAPAAPSSTPAASVSPSASPPTQTTHVASAPTGTQAPGAAPGLVWVNSSTHVYHCPSDPYYGKTKNGNYMTESDALAKGAHPDHGKACK